MFVCVCVCLCTRIHRHTCASVPSSWAKACLWESMVAGSFWFCLAPWEASQAFLLERTLLLNGEDKPPHQPRYADGFARAVSHQRPSLQRHPALTMTDVQVACPLLCPQGQLWKPGCWRREAQALPLCPNCSHGIVCHASEQRRHILPWKSSSSKKKMWEETAMLEEKGQYFTCSDSFKMP